MIKAKMYGVLSNGRNILAEFEGRVYKVGFYTTRFVEAPTTAKAMILAPHHGSTTTSTNAGKLSAPFLSETRSLNR